MSKFAIASLLLGLASLGLFLPTPACAPSVPVSYDREEGVAVSALIEGGTGGAPAKGNIVISQVYGGGGGANATYLNDYVELLNRTKSPLSLDGLTLQVASAEGDFGAGGVLALSGVVGAGEYVLVQLDSANPGDGDPLPPADLTGSLVLGESVGKVALTTSPGALACGGLGGRCPTDKIIDMVGYGLVTDFEGSRFANPIDVQQAALRKDNGCTDANDNSKDFTSGTPSPRNAASPKADCPQTTPPPKDGGSSGPVPPVVDPKLGPEPPGPDASAARDGGARPSGGASEDCAVAAVGSRGDTSPGRPAIALGLVVMGLIRRRARRARPASA